MMNGEWLVEYAPWLIAMGALMLGSAFFSASEAALFYLGRREVRRLEAGRRSQRIAAALLAEPDRLLTAVLFWNLVVNMAYFAVSSITSIHLDRSGRTTEAGVVALTSLLLLIFFGEMLPKSLAVVRPLAMVSLVAIPLAATVRLADPLLPAFRLVSLLLRRLLWPRFRPEPYLAVRDLERAVQLSKANAALVEQEHTVLQHIVLLSEIRADELMRPRTQFFTFRPPVKLADLRGRMPRSGYLLLSERDSEEVAAAIPLGRLWSVPTEHLEQHAEPLACIPWCISVAQALEAMQREDRQVAAVVNEFGETIGILTFDDILDTIFHRTASRSERLLQRKPIRDVAPGVWHVTGMTSLRRLVRYFRVERPPSKSLTVAGVVQEMLERMPEPGDQCRWGPFQLRVLDVLPRGQLLVELRMADEKEAAP